MNNFSILNYIVIISGIFICIGIFLIIFSEDITPSWQTEQLLDEQYEADHTDDCWKILNNEKIFQRLYEITRPEKERKEFYMDVSNIWAERSQELNC